MLISFSIFSSLLFCFTFSFLFSLCILGSPLLRFNFVQISCQPMGISCKPLRISCQPNGNILSTYGNILSTWERKSWPLSPQGRLRPRWAHPGLKQIIFRWGKWVSIFAMDSDKKVHNFFPKLRFFYCNQLHFQFQRWRLLLTLSLVNIFYIICGFLLNFKVHTSCKNNIDSLSSKWLLLNSHIVKI